MTSTVPSPYADSRPNPDRRPESAVHSCDAALVGSDAVSEEVLALSPAQRSIVDAQLLDPDSDVFVVADRIDIRGTVSTTLLARAIEQTSAGTEAFGTRVRCDEVTGEPFRMAGPVQARVRIYDVSAQADPQAAAQQLIEAELARGAGGLSAQELVGHLVVRLSAGHVVWLMRCHHVMADGYGLSLVAQKVAERYRELAAMDAVQGAARSVPTGAETGSARTVDDVPMGDWQPGFGSLETLINADIEAARTADSSVIEPVLDRAVASLCVDGQVPTVSGRSVPAVRRAIGIDVVLDPDATKAMTRITTRERSLTWADIHTALYAAFAARAAGTDAVVLGIPFSARGTRLAALTPSMSVTVLPLPVRIDPQHTIKELARDVGKDLSSLRRVQHLRGEQLAADLKVPTLLRGPGVNLKPYTPTLDFGVAQGRMRTETAGPVDDLDLSIAAGPDGLTLRLEANPDAYTHHELTEIAARYRGFVQQALEHPDLPLGRIPALPVGDTGADASEPLPESGFALVDVSHALAAAARRYPDDVAVRSGHDNLTFADLHARVRLLAERLAHEGAGPERVVAIALPRGIDLVVAILAVLETGAALTPVDLGYPPERITYLLDDCDPVLVLASGDTWVAQHPRAFLIDGEPGRGGRDLDDVHGSATRSEEAVGDQHQLPGTYHPASLAYLIYTSGSTGAPKGVGVSRGSLAFFLAHHAATLFGPTAERAGRRLRAAHTASFSFDSSWEQLLWLLLGHELVIFDEDDRRDARAVVEAIDELRLDTLDVTPSFATGLVEAGLLETVHRPELFLIGGEAAPADLWQKLANSDLRSHNYYGPTEATVDALEAPVAGERPTIGRALAGTDALVLDRALHPVPVGVAGELYLSGPHLARGYQGRPDLTASRFIADPRGGGGRLYRTGDIVRIEDDGTVSYLGRSDDQVKIRGHRVELGEVRQALISLDGVAQAVAVVRTTGGATRLLGFVIPDDGAHLDASELLDRVRGTVPDHLVPHALGILDEFPLTAHGKLDTAALAEPDLPIASGQAPQTDRERAVCAAIGDVLGSEFVPVDVDIVTLGADSIAAISIVSALRRRGWVARPRDLFAARTARGVAQLLQELNAASPASDGQSTSRVSATGPVPATPVVRELERLSPSLSAVAGYAHSVVLTVSDLDQDRLREALCELSRRHPILQMTVTEGPDGWDLVIPEAAAGATIKPVHDAVIGESAGGTATAVAAGAAVTAVPACPFTVRTGNDLDILRTQLVEDLDPASGQMLAVGLCRDDSEGTRGCDLGGVHRGGPKGATQAGVDAPGSGQAGMDGDGCRVEIVLVAHHLVIDGVSWRLLIRELSELVDTGHRGAAGGHESVGADLNPVGSDVKSAGSDTSFAGVDANLAGRAVDAEWRRRALALDILSLEPDEEHHWRRIAQSPCALFPQPPAATPCHRVTRIVHGADSKVAEAVLRTLPAYLHARPDTVLAGALTATLREWSGVTNGNFLLDWETHGRDPLVPGDEMAHGLGWFTAEFPIAIDLGLGEESSNGTATGTLASADATNPQQLAEAIRAARHALASTPRDGLGADRVRDESGTPMRARPSVLLNYLGRFSEEPHGDHTSVRLAGERPFEVHFPPDLQIAHSLEVAVFVRPEDAGLDVEWSFAPELAVEADRIIATWERALSALTSLADRIAENPAGTPPTLIPEEAAATGLDLTTVRRCEREYGPLLDIAPLSPMQEGLLFHALKDGDQDVYLTTTTVHLEMAPDRTGRREPIDPELIAQAVRVAVTNNPQLGAAFVVGAAEGPVQLIPRDPTAQVSVHGLNAGADMECADQNTADRQCSDSDIDRLPDTGRVPDQFIAQLTQSELARRVDVSRPPLLRAHIVRTGRHTATLVLAAHHLLMDGWSTPLLIDQILAETRTAPGTMIRTAPGASQALGVSQAAGASHAPGGSEGWLCLRRALTAQQHRDDQDARRVWAEYLDDVSGGTVLGGDQNPKNHMAPVITETIAVPLAADDGAALATTARTAGLTMSTVLTGAWAHVVGRALGRTDVVVGVTTSGRSAAVEGITEAIGLLSATVPARYRMRPDEPFEDQLRRFQKQRAELHEVESLPLAEIESTAGVGSLFDTLVVVENYPAGTDDIAGGVRIAGIEAAGATHYAVGITLLPDMAGVPTGRDERSETVRIDLDYDRARISPTTARALADELAAVLSALGRNLRHTPLTVPAGSNGAPPVVEVLVGPTPDQTPDDGNGTCAVVRSLVRAAEADPDAIAVRYQDRAVGTRDLIRLAGGIQRAISGVLASAMDFVVTDPAAIDPATTGPATTDSAATDLAAIDPATGMGARTVPHGVSERRAALHDAHEVVVALALPRGIEIVAAITACLAYGAAFVPMDPSLPADRVMDLIADSGASLVMAPAGSDVARRAHQANIPVIDPTDPEALTPCPLTPRAVPGQSAAYLIYTSGSTGRPKAVVITRDALDTHFEGLRTGRHAELVERITAQRGRRRIIAVHSASFSFDTSFIQLHWMFAGHELLVLDEDERRDPALFAARARGADVIDVAPVLAEQLLAVGLFDGDDPLPEVFLGGEAVTPRLWSALRDRADRTRALNLYGPTETTVDALGQLVHDAPTPLIGTPVAGINATVLDPWLRPVPRGAVGELYISGGQLARGYAGRPGLTAASFVAAADGVRRYRTGDLVRVAEDGHVEYLGRVDDQLKISGYRIEPGEVETALRVLPEVEQAAAFADVPGSVAGRLLAAVTRSNKANGNLDPDAVKEALASSLPHYMVPSQVLVLDQLPLTTSGKVNKSALRDLAAQRGRGDTRVLVPPSTPEEKALVAAVSETLGAQVSVSDDFFQLGGHSLTALRVIGALRGAGWSLGVADIFGQRTLRRIATMMSESGAPSKLMKDTDRGVTSGFVPISRAQRRLLFLAEVEGANSTYTVPVSLELSGPVAPQRLASAWEKVVRHHPVLRTVYRRLDGDFGAQVLSDPPPSFAVEEIRMPAVNDPGMPGIGDRGVVGSVDSGERARCGLDLLEQRIAQEEARTFDLFDAPPVRLTLLTCGARQVLVLAAHHIAVDETSIQVILEDLSAVLNGKEPKPAVSFAEAISPTVSSQEAGGDPEALDRWRQRLAGIPVELELPTDHPRPDRPGYRAQTVNLTVPDDLSRRVNQLAADRGVTPLMVLQTAVATLLQALGAGEDVVLGSPVSTRTDERAARTVGYLVNTLPIRLNLSDPTVCFAELVQRTRDAVLDALADAQVPFDAIVDALTPPRALSRHPLFQTMVAIEAPVDAHLSFGDITAKEREGVVDAARFDLAVRYRPAFDRDASDRGGVAEGAQASDTSARLALVASADLFDSSTAVELADRLMQWLDQATMTPHVPLSAFDARLPRERERQAVDSGVHAEALSLLSAFAHRVETTPEALALVAGGDRIQYAQLARRVVTLRNALLQAGVTSQDRVAVATGRGPELIVALLGVLAAGAAYVPLDVDYPDERIITMLDDADPAMVIVDETTRGAGRGRRELVVARSGDIGIERSDDMGIERSGDMGIERSGDMGIERSGEYGSEYGDDSGAGHVGNSGGQFAAVYDTLATTPANPRQLAEILRHSTTPHDSAAYVIYTSGSTGRPKGVVIPRNALEAFIAHEVAALNLKASDRMLSVTTVSFDIAALEIYVPLVSGATVVLAGREEVRDPDRLAGLIRAERATILQATPSLWRPLLEAQPDALAGVMALSGGEALPADLAASLCSACRSVRNVYGPTEATVWATAQNVIAAENRPDQLGKDSASILPIGVPFNGIRAEVLDALLRPVPDGVPGELYLSGTQLAHGYLGRPDLTCSRFVADPYGKPGERMYRTGDLVTRDGNGTLRFLRRVDDQVKVDGHRIELGEVDAALRAIRGVRRAASVVRADHTGRARLLGYVVPEPGVQLDVLGIRQALADKLPAAYIPRSVSVLDEIPLTLNGKIARNALPDPATCEDRQLRSPRTDAERAVVDAVAETLGRPDISVDDAFFELGGDSISSIRLVALVRQRGFVITPGLVFSQGNLADLAAAAQPLNQEPVRRTRRTRARLNARDLGAIERLLEDPR
ncbi:non-ribosomal peptide synthetase [Devriesea agamarum]|uniref:non-ribosomal peptide synthetase n=1 Tax=Devriesea agamarum TaxID=472569 RepID=UPI00071DA59B|nr:non-ribosomal peptide synthetase [Devriesea agamarum]